MTDTQKRTKNPNAPGFLGVGVVFIAVAIVFLLTGMNGIWVAFFTIGVVFMSMSAMPVGHKKDEADSPSAD